MDDPSVVPKPRLPRHAVEAWGGGFVLDKPEYVASIAAVDGTVVAATEHIYLLRPGATQFKTRRMPAGAGDAVAVAVEPRRPGSRSRFAVAGVDSLHLFEGEGVASLQFPKDHGEVRQLLWAPDVRTREAARLHYIGLDDSVLQLVPDGGPFGTLVELEGDIADARAMATDPTGGFAFACFHEDSCELEVSFLADLETDLWYCRTFETPAFFAGASLAIAGKSVAVSFDLGGLWLTRDIEHLPFREVEELSAGLSPEDGGGGAAIAFEGAANDSALIAVAAGSPTTLHVSRIDAKDRVTRIAEVDIEGKRDEIPSVRGIAWDPTRRTLWSAAGRAGILCTTAPGAPSPLGVGALS